MKVNQEIAALRRDRSPQRRAQAAMEDARQAWLAEPDVRAAIVDLARFGAGAPLEKCPALEEIFTGSGGAERLTALLSQHYCAAIEANPIGHPPFRNGFDGLAASIQLARMGRAQLMLQAREPGPLGTDSASFSDAIRFEAVVAGKATARIVRKTGEPGQPVCIHSQPLALSGGERIALDLANEAFVVDHVERRLVVLRLMRTNVDPDPTRAYDIASGEFLHQSAGLIATSRQEAIIALLGRMGRTDAAPEMARVAIAESDHSLRWQALRECLALDTERGFCTLARIARDGQDPLAASAGALRAQLLEQYPQLAELEASQCPA